jgi:hypothetical protein
VQATLKQAADTAVTLVQSNLPRALPKVTLPAMMQEAPARTKGRTRVARAKTAAKARGTRTTKRVRKAAAKK